MSKLITIISTILLISILSSGCTSSGIETKQNEEIQVKVLIQDPAKNGFEKYLTYMEEKFPHITFEVASLDEMLDADEVDHADRAAKSLEIIEEQKADLFYDVRVPDDYPLANLANLVDRDKIQLNNIQQSMFNASTRTDGSVTHFSPTFDRKALIINRKLFKENGIAEPVSPMTWDDFRATAKQVQETNPTLTGYDFPSYRWYDALISAGEVMNGLQFVSSDGQLLLYQPEWRNLAEQLLEDSTNKVMNKTPIESDYVDKWNSAMVIADAYLFREFLDKNATPDTLTIMELPINPASPTPAPYSGVSYFSINGESQYVNELWKVLTFLMSEEAATDISSKNLSYGYTPYPAANRLGTFSLESFAGSTIVEQNKNTYSLAIDTHRTLIDTVESQFQSHADGNLDFDAMWSAIESMVKEINKDSKNFVELK